MKSQNIQISDDSPIPEIKVMNNETCFGKEIEDVISYESEEFSLSNLISYQIQ